MIRTTLEVGLIIYAIVITVIAWRNDSKLLTNIIPKSTIPKNIGWTNADWGKLLPVPNENRIP